jgi:ferredoxin
MCPSHESRIYYVDIEPGVQRIEANSNQTLLASLEQAGVDWPSSCRNGTCRACIGQLASGRVRYEIKWPGLSAEEKQEGHVLPCAAVPCSDLVLTRC